MKTDLILAIANRLARAQEQALEASARAVEEGAKVIANVPEAIAAAHFGTPRRDFAVVMTLTAPVDFNYLNIGDRLTAASGVLPEGLQPEWLQPHAKAVYEHCLEVGLKPVFEPIVRHASALIIRWDESDLVKLLEGVWELVQAQSLMRQKVTIIGQKAMQARNLSEQIAGFQQRVRTTEAYVAQLRKQPGSFDSKTVERAMARTELDKEVIASWQEMLATLHREIEEADVGLRAARCEYNRLLSEPLPQEA